MFDSFQIDTDLSPILNAISQLQGKLDNQTPLMTKIGGYIVERAERGFETETDPYGSKWQPLSPATIVEKQRKGYPNKILTRTGRLANSFRILVRGNSVRIASTVGYSRYHQIGTKKMAKRAMLPGSKLSAKDESNVVAMSVEYIDI